ncbi:MAG: hypothetical protein ACRDFB_04765 [Rhabdochlamydiaceae bacterium]
MNNLKIALTLAFLPIFIHADGELALHDTNNMTQAEQSATPFIEYHNRMAVFDPFHQVYERIKPNALYTGVEAWVSGAFGSQVGSILAEAEFRMGYNFFYQGRDHLTPFVGAGIISATWGHTHRKYIDFPAVAYGTLGILYDHEFNSVVNLGANLKGMIGGDVSKKRHNWHGPIVGFDASIPLTFRFGHKRHWDYRIEPFDICFYADHEAVNYFGFRNTLGYRF